MYVLSLKRLGKGAQNGGKPSLPPYQSLHWIFFWPGGGPYFYWGLLVLFSPWKPQSCPLRKLLSAQGTADPLSPFKECSHWVK